MAPFAEHTISLVADISYGLNRQHAVHLRKYLDDPAVVDYQERWDSMRTVLRGVAAYSLAIVTVSKSDLSEKEKVAQLANFLDQLKKPVADAPVLEYQPTRDELEHILANIREQSNLLDGLDAAQPIVEWVAWYAGVELDSLKVISNELWDHFLERIEADFAGVVEFNDMVRDAQVMTLRSAMLLSKHRGTGDPEYVAQIRETDLSLKPYLPEGNVLTLEELERAENRLTFRLAEYRETQQLLAHDLETYNNMIRELDVLVNDNSALLMKTRATIWIWSRAHARLAAGITDPAKVDIMGIAKRAMDAAMPF